MAAKEIISKFGIALFALMLISTGAYPCSICLCGDELYLYGHGNQLMDGKFSISFENRYFSKSSGGTEIGSVVFEEQREYRPALVLAYGVSNKFTLTANVSSSFKKLKETELGETESTNISGLGDLQVEGMWNQEISANPNQSYLVGVFGAVKAPTGDNDREEGGIRHDEHGQPGTGSWDFSTGLGLTRICSKSSNFITVFYRINGTNDHEYHFGNSLSFNIGGDVRPKQIYALTLAVNGRYATRDDEDGVELPNTGGWVLYLTPGMRFDLQSSFGIVANLQIPVYEDLYEEQDEDMVLNLTIRYDVL